MRMAIFVLLTCLSGSLAAADRNGNYAVWGPGQKSCYSYSQAREAGNDDAYKYFVMGYLTAYNTLTDETYRVSGEMDLAEILSWLDDYCGPKAVHGFEQAVTTFIVEHHEQRLIKPLSEYRR
jgi:hypothetical protein